MRATFRPAGMLLAKERGGASVGPLVPDLLIEVLVIDESGPGVEIRIMSDGQVLSYPLSQGVEHYRSSPLWEEIVDET